MIERLGGDLEVKGKREARVKEKLVERMVILVRGRGRDGGDWRGSRAQIYAK